MFYSLHNRFWNNNSFTIYISLISINYADNIQSIYFLRYKENFIIYFLTFTDTPKVNAL